MTIVKFNPVRDLLNLEREVNKIFNTLENKIGSIAPAEIDEGYENAVWAPLTDVYEDKDGYTLKIDLPGIKKEDVKINYVKGKLSICGERNQETESKDAKWTRIEKIYGKYYRAFNLPEEIQADKISAEFKDGLLTIRVPKAEEIKPKEIEIKIN